MIRVTDLPKYMVSKELASGAQAWYWSPNARLVTKDCPFQRQPLGSELGLAMTAAKLLNLNFEFWRQFAYVPKSAEHIVATAMSELKTTGGIPEGSLGTLQAMLSAEAQRRGGADPEKIPGTFAHMLKTYREANPSKAKSFAKMKKKTQRKAQWATKLVADFVLKDGATVGSKMVRDFDQPFVDALYEKLVIRPGKLDPGGEPAMRRRTINEAMAYCRRAWAVAYRTTPLLVPEYNPFSKMGLDHSREETIPATYAELCTYEEKAAELGYPDIAFIARAAWELLQRVEEICTTFKWDHWRPADHPNQVFVGNEKNDAKVWKPLRDDDGEFYPELEQRLMACPRLGDYVCMFRQPMGPKPKTGPDNRRIALKPLKTDLMFKRARAVRIAAGLPEHVTLASFRHGGLTELGDAGLPDTLAQAQSRHKQRGTLDHYIHRTDAQQRKGARLRVAHRRGEAS
mgnify:CR=1 FL=1